MPTPVHPLGNASIRPSYQGMASRRGRSSGGRRREKGAQLEFSPQPVPPSSPGRRQQAGVLRTPRLGAAASPSPRKLVINCGDSGRDGQQLPPVSAAKSHTPRSEQPVSEPSHTPRSEQGTAPPASPMARRRRFQSRDWESEISSEAQWSSVRGTRQVLCRGKEATDAELTQALQQITATIAAQIGGGQDLAPECTCWVGEIPTECANQEALSNALEQFGAIRSVTVRAKPGRAKSWALVVFRSADAAERAKASTVTVEDAQGEPSVLKVRTSKLRSELTKSESSALMQVALKAKATAAAAAGPEEDPGAETSVPSDIGRARPPSYRTMMLLRASVLNNLGRNGKAIEDLETLVDEQLSDSTSYRILAKTQRAHTLNQAGGWSASDQPGAIVPSVHSLRKAAARRPTDAKLNGEYRESIGDVQRERPFWMPSPRRKKVEGLDDVQADWSDGQKKLKNPWHYDLVVERVAELAVTRAQLLDVRDLLRRSVPMLVSTFRYYSQLGSSAENKKFAQVRPSRSNINEINEIALAATGRIFGAKKVKNVKGDDMDEFLVGRPVEALSLWQFRQLLLDCNVLSTECRMADCGRLFALCSRPTTAPPTPKRAKGTSRWGAQVSVYDVVIASASDDAHRLWSESGIEPNLSSDETDESEANVHDQRRRLHVYGFLECLVRLSATKYGLPRPALAADGQTRAVMNNRLEQMRGTGVFTIATQFQTLLTDCILPFSCSHENIKHCRWDSLLPETEELVRGARAQLDKIFSFFSTDASSSGVDGFIAHGSSHELYEKYRAARPELKDNTLSFNQLCTMLDKAGLLTASLPPRQLAGLWEEVTGYASTQPGVEKANLRAEMTRGEFVDFLLAVRRKVVPVMALNSPGAIEAWFLNELLPSINGAMPLRGDALAKSMATSSNHYLSTGAANLKAAKKRLARVPLFSEIADEKFVDVVGAALKPRSFGPDDPIITAGEVGSEMYFLVEGEVDVIVRGNHVATLGPGSWFGEMALLSNELRNADVVASSGCHPELFALSKAALQQAVDSYPRLASQLQQEMAARQIMHQKVGEEEEEEEEEAVEAEAKEETVDN